MRLNHIINPFTPSEGHDVAIAQPLTFESLKIARNFSKDKIDINHFAAFFEEDESSSRSFHKTEIFKKFL